MKKLLYLSIIFFYPSLAQKQVAITIDDVPNVMVYQRNGFSSPLLKQINDLNIPATIFINERNIYHNEFVQENFAGLVTWLKNKNITAGNHAFAHLNYADVGTQAFQEDIIKGETITKEITSPNQKLKYFRFPYNSLGDDSVSHVSIASFLEKHGYIITPFSVDSEDWAYAVVYEEALKNKNLDKARQVGEQYLKLTMLRFEYFEKLSQQRFGRQIKQIYLCHDRQLNIDYWPKLIELLRGRGYMFITLDEAMEDPIYKSQDFYFGRGGFSWIYRWERDPAKRKALLQAEPEDKSMRAEYDQITKSNSKK